MKHIIVLCIACLGMACQAQTVQDFFSDKTGPVTWLGIDYSHVKLAGDFTQFKDAGPIPPAEVRDKYFPAWNSLVLNEATKYDFRGMFMVSSLVPDINMVTALNAATDSEKMKDGNENKFNNGDIKNFIVQYDLKEKEGLGIVLIADFMNKSSEMAGYYVVVFNMTSRDVILCESVVEKAGGIGMRNYWGGSLYNLVKDGKKNLYWAWKAKYNK
ncbi:MAG: hypothetical protein NTY96_02370 [Bacteroidetes bacterium]|nr:hypothetical protein [Bacteroidota bacterium]